MKHMVFALSLKICMLVGLGNSLMADEIDSLVKLSNPPARFKDHKVSFSVKETTFTFNHVNGPKKEKFHIILDGKKIVGFIRGTNYVDEGIRLLDFYPDALPVKLTMPTGRFHYENEMGPFLQTIVGGIPIDSPYTIITDAKTVTIERRHDGQVNTCVVKFDPVLGYMVDGTYKMKPDSQKVAVSKATCPGTFSPWMENSRYYYTIISPGGRFGYEGYVNSTAGLDKGKRYIRKGIGGFTIRENGFVAFAKDKAGWTACFTRTGGGISTKAEQCNAHDVIKYKVNRPTDGIIRQKLIGLPPEVTSLLLKKTTIHQKSDSAITIRIGKTETFEDQPLPCTALVRGLFSSKGLFKLSNVSYSGKKSMIYSGELWPDIPQVVMLPKSTYQLTAMLKAEGDSTKAYITGKTYEWTPYDKKFFETYSTDTVEAKDGWKKVSFTIKTDKWDPFIDFKFFAEKGTAYLDDFSFVKVGK